MKTKILIISVAILCLAPQWLRATGGIDYTFSQPIANGPVFAVAATPDGHIWMGGYFNSVNGSAHASEGSASLSDTYYCLAVLNTNGTLDADFTLANFTSLPVNFLNYYYVSAIAVDQSQNTVYVGFSPNGGYNTEAFIARFDPVFGQPGRWTLNPGFTQNTLSHISGVIHSLAVGDGGLYVAANVYDNPTTSGYHSPLGKFDTSGTLDNGYTLSPAWGSGEIFQVRYYPAGAIVEPGGGSFTWPSSLLLSGAAGVGDATTAPYPPVNSVVITCADKQKNADQIACPLNGEILAGGAGAPYQNYPPGSEYSGFELHRMGGTLQTPAFSSATNYPADQGQNLSWVEALPGGDALVAGLFTRIHGSYVNNFTHVLPDGTVDPNFDNNTSFGWVFSMAQEPDGKYLLCGEGSYTEPVFGYVYGGVERRELLPTNGVAFTSQPQPANQTVYAGDRANIYAGASGWPGLVAQWRKDGNDLAGQTSTSLYLNDVTTNDSGQYSLFIQNEAACSASVVSSNVTLTVLPTPPAPANDAFANAISLSGPTVNGSGTLRSATLDDGETDDAGVYDGRSVWWTWTALVSGPTYVDVSDCDFPAVIGLFTGNDVSSLTVVTNNYDYGLNNEEGNSGLLTNFVFNAIAGTTYRIAIGGTPNPGSLGNIIFTIGQNVISWAQNPSPTANWLIGVAAGNHRLVAVGEGNTIVTSTDGENWSTDTVSATSSYLYGVTVGNGIFIATGGGGTVLTSSDGTNWTQQTSGTTTNLWGVTFGHSIFVAVGDEGVIITSPDGTNWTQQAIGGADLLQSIVFDQGIFVAVGGYGNVATSSDGTNWTFQVLSDTEDELWGVTSDHHQFVAVGDDGEIVTSPDGVNWTSQTSPVSGTSLSLYNVSYGDGHFVAVGDSGTLLLSTDGTNWVTDNSGVTEELDAVTYYEQGSFVIVGEDGLILFNPPPRLGQLSLLPGHTLQFSLNGLNGSTAIIEATPTLAPPDWQPVATNIIDHGVVTFTDTMTSRSLYYRARVQ